MRLGKELDENSELAVFVNCVPRSMTVATGKAALNLLMKSERVFTDLNRWLEFSEDLEPVRDYDPSLTP